MQRLIWLLEGLAIIIATGAGLCLAAALVELIVHIED